MSKYADIEQIKKVIREEWIKYIPMEFDMNISFVLGKIAEVPTMDIVHCKDCKWHTSDDECTHPHWDCEERTDYPIAMDFDYCKHGERKE